MSKFRDDQDWDRMAQIPAQVGPSLVEQLIASPNQFVHDQFPEELRDAVQDGIAQLGPKDRFVIEASYIWGYSYSEIADMMGYRSKGTPHYAIKKAERNLGAILKKDKRIIQLLKGNSGVDTSNWADSAWKQLRYFDSQTNKTFLRETFGYSFIQLSNIIRTMGEDENADVKLYDACTLIGAEAARGLAEIGQWDTEAMLDILCRKQHDYGHGNINAFGIVGVAVRISDKIARYENLTGKNTKEQNESLLDTLMDMVGYAVIARMLEDGTFDLPLIWEV